MLVPTYIDLATDKPPDNTTGAVPRAEASVVEVNVTLPEAETVVPLNDEEVIVLLLSASDPAKVARVPLVGRVTEVLAVNVSVVEYAPLSVRAPAVEILPPRVIV